MLNQVPNQLTSTWIIGSKAINEHSQNEVIEVGGK